MTASPISDLNPILMAARCTLTLASSGGKWDKFCAVLDMKALPREVLSTPPFNCPWKIYANLLLVDDACSHGVIETEWWFFVEITALIFLSKTALRG